MTFSMPFKYKLSPHRHRGGEGYEYAFPLTLGTESCQSMRHQDNFFYNFVTSKGKLIEKVLPLAIVWLKGVTCKNNRRIAPNHGFQNSWYEFWTRWYEYLYPWYRLCAPLASVKIITDNYVKTVVFGNTDIPHPRNQTVPQRSVAGSSSISILFIYLMQWSHFCTNATSIFLLPNIITHQSLFKLSEVHFLTGSELFVVSLLLNIIAISYAIQFHISLVS
jgi:hypothetical protein